MLFSFVLPAYKAKYLAESIESILSQTYKEFELIIVNDASPEDLDSIVNSFHDTRIKYYKNSENIGGKDLVKQWNHCLTFAKGEYVILASDDDLYMPDFLSTFIPLIEKYPQVNVFRSRILDIDGNGNICGTDNYYKEYINTNEFRYLWFIGIKGGIANYIFKREHLLSQGGFVNFPLAWGSDDATILQMANNGIINSQDYLFKFRWSGINISSQHDNKTLINKLIARIELCYWRQNYLNISIKTNFDRFYQERILTMNEVYNYNAIYRIIKKMKFITFISCIKTLYSFNLLNKKQKNKIIFDRTRTQINILITHLKNIIKSFL